MTTLCIKTSNTNFFAGSVVMYTNRLKRCYKVKLYLYPSDGGSRVLLNEWSMCPGFKEILPIDKYFLANTRLEVQVPYGAYQSIDEAFIS